jgi:hypothetical protein
MRPLFAAVFLVPTLAFAQSPTATTVTPINGATGVKAGGSINLALQVVLPEGLHAQSNKPKDESLIATTLTFEPNAAATPIEVVFPPAQEFKLDTGDLLMVFEHEFVIGAQRRICCRSARRVFGIVLRQKRQQCAQHIHCFFFAVRRKMCDPAHRIVDHRAAKRLKRNVFMRHGAHHVRTRHKHIARVLYH